MARKLSIQYGSLTIDDGRVQVHGLTSLDLAFDAIQYTFDIVVSADTPGDLATEAATLEAALRKRDQDLVITAHSGSWGNYRSGYNALNTSARINKSGDIDSDTGVSRVYSVTFSAEHAADDLDGLRAINAQLTFAPSRQMTLTVTGEYTALDNVKAREKYNANVQSWIDAIQAYIDPAVTWEREDEDTTWDRNNHILQFQQVWLQLIHNQTEGELDDPRIVSHKCIFTRISSYPGDAECTTNRPEIVLAEYSAFVNLDEDPDLNELENQTALYEDAIYPWLKKQIDDAWSPKGIAATQQSRQFDPSSARFMARVTFQIYMTGSDLIEVTKNERYHDQRMPDYSPVWDDDELAAYVDQGFMIRTRTNTKTETRFGVHEARPLLRPNNVRPQGWNRLDGMHDAQPMCIGEGDDQVRVTVLIESIMERFTRMPGETGASGPYTVPAFEGPRPGYSDRGEGEYGIENAITPGGRSESGVRVPGSRDV